MTTRRNTSFSGGGGGGGMTLTFPPFSRAVKWLLGINLGVFVLLELIALASADAYGSIVRVLIFTPRAFVHGFVWKALTYSFVHVGVMHILTSMIGIWIIGGMVESIFGSRRFLRYYFICVLGGAATSLALGYSGVPNGPEAPLIGAGAANYGLLLAIALLMGETEFMMFPLPVQIKAKYLAAITIVVAVLMSLGSREGIMGFASLGGMLAGFAYIKLWQGSSGRRTPASGVGRGLSDRMYAVAPAQKESFFVRWQNRFQRWKRRRMAKKFEVYMRKHDRTVYFDEHGNYRGHEGDPKDEGESGRKPWVN